MAASTGETRITTALQEHGPKVHSAKVAVVGTGAVGMAVTYALLNQGLCSSLALIDVDQDKVKGELDDLQHGAAFIEQVELEGGKDYEHCAGAALVIITAGVRQREGETRLQLLERNVRVFQMIVPNVVKHAPEASMLIVTNPCDIMTAVAAKLSGLPPGRVFGSGTSLDSSRFRSLIAKELGVAIRSVHGYILGEHGDSSVPIWSQVSVGCSPLASAVDASLGTHQPGGVWSGMHQDVVKAAYSVIKAKGYTNWAIGLTVASIARAVLRDERRVLPVSVPAQGHHDIHHDVYLSLPAVVGAGGALSIISATLARHETEMLQKSAEALHTTAAGLAF
ncbi:unnamed protein product [Symbiodinium sp. KB8]|nr:unnamed protein product [Symbiodinium sp. KB8]